MKSRYLLAALFALMPLGAMAADYAVTFGEARADSTTITPTTTIKMCLKDTGYRFAYEVRPSDSSSYREKAILHLPTPAKTVGAGIQSQNYGHDLVTEEEDTQTTAYHYDFYFDEGDPLGTWGLDVVVNDTIVAAIKFNVVAATSCP